MCIGYASRRADVAEVVADCKACGVPAVAVRCDVTVEADVVRLFAAADALGAVSGLVNNAGVLGPQSRVVHLDPARIERILATCSAPSSRRSRRSAGWPPPRAGPAGRS